MNKTKSQSNTNYALVPCNTTNQAALIIATTNLLRAQLSIDNRLRAALKPAILDQAVLRPNRYYAMLEDTRSAIISQIQNESTEETREALTGLQMLLEENAMLMSLLDQYMNNVKRA